MKLVLFGNKIITYPKCSSKSKWKVKEFIIEKDLENQYVKALVNPIYNATAILKVAERSCKDHAKTL